MVLFNHATREMTAKIVYYGPGLCGKTTNLLVIFDKLDPKQKGKMLSLATKTDRTLFFDLLPVDIGKVGNFNLKIQLYTVPGQVFYNETRKLVLKGADSVVFVADSQPAMVDANRESFANLMDNLEANHIDPNDTPVIIQYNKRDIPGVLSVDELQEALGFEGYPFAEASAVKGEGVMETFKLASKITAKHLMNRLKGAKNEPVRRVEAKAAPAKATAKPKAAAAPVPATPAAAEPSYAFGGSTPTATEPTNPFADSVPFPESDANPLDSGYEKMEEVSLEQLLEGRERPATMSGSTPIPIPIEVEEVEELDAEELMPVIEEAPLAVAVMEEPQTVSATTGGSDRLSALEAEVQQLKSRIKVMRDEKRTTLESILQELKVLTERVRTKLNE